MFLQLDFCDLNRLETNINIFTEGDAFIFISRNLIDLYYWYEQSLQLKK